MIGRAIDNLIGIFAPAAAAERIAARATLDQINAVTNGKGGYDAGKWNRLTRHFSRSNLTENTVPRAQIDQLHAESWNLYRNNPHARKVVRSIESKVIGRGPSPVSLATHADGTPHIEFRTAAQKLWWAMCNCIDVRGLPGRGGLDFVELQKQALRATVLGGEVLRRIVPLTAAEQRKRSAPVPISLQLISGDRLSTLDKADGFAQGNSFYRGIELDSSGRRVAYHVYPPAMGEFDNRTLKPNRIAARDIGHLYLADDVDQLRGVPWFAASLMWFRDSGDLQYNVLKASAMAACVVGGYRLAAGQRKLGLQAADPSELTDPDGNAITRMSPGMFLNLGKDGDIKGFSPNQPNTNAEAFIQHILRSIAGGVPGVKSSTITGDYRNSSFSSERSADNDTWPEIESLQDWFSTAFLQPIYEAIVEAGMVEGWFTGAMTAEEFVERRSDLLATHWQGPVARSINPTDDAKAAMLRMQGGQSSPQLECARVGVDWQDVIRDLAEFQKFGAEQGLPESFLLGVLSVEPAPEPATDESNADKASAAA